MKHILVLISISFLTISCGSETSPNENEVKDSVPADNTRVVTDTVKAESDTISREKNPPQNDADKVRLVVSFISRGEGIDLKLKTGFDNWLAKKQNVKYEVQPWGREGELNYCFALSNMSPGDQDAFVKEVRNHFAGRQTVYMNENTNCDNWHK